MKADKIPSFGPLEGVSVLGFVNSLAGPYALMRLADYGANVVWVENPKNPDMFRPSKWQAEVERRNMRSICMDIPNPECREAFGALLKNTDIYIDAFRGGQMDRWGLSDEVLWSYNPALVIVHISGYGQTGAPEYVNKPSYDPVAQAFSGWLEINGYPDRKPTPVMPGTGDYITGLFAAFAAVSALHKARVSGEGESVDLAQYEIMASIMGGQSATFMNAYGDMPVRRGSGMPLTMFDIYECADGKSVYTCVQGANTLRKAIKFLDLEDKVKFAPYITKDTKDGQLIEETFLDYCKSHTAAEVEKALSECSIPCGAILTVADTLENPHYIEREVYTEWENEEGVTIKGINIFPRMTKHPCQIWRGMGERGADGEDILLEAGLSQEEIQKLYDGGVLFNDAKAERKSKFGLHSQFGTLCKHPQTMGIMQQFTGPMATNGMLVGSLGGMNLEQVLGMLGDKYPDAAKQMLIAALEAID